MATYSKEIFSGSTNGRNILVAQTATAGTLIHTAHATAKDEVYLHATNTDTSAVKLTIEFGGTTSPNDLHEAVIPPESGAILVIPGWPITGSVVVRAFAATANVITINGYVNRITP